MAQGELEVLNARNTVAVCLGAVGSAAESARGPATVLTLDDAIGSALALAGQGPALIPAQGNALGFVSLKA